MNFDRLIQYLAILLHIILSLLVHVDTNNDGGGDDDTERRIIVVVVVVGIFF